MHTFSKNVNEPRISRVDSRTAILDAADRLLARYGFSKMTIQDIADEARLSRRTIYLHFRDKEDIALASMDRRMDGLVSALRRASAGEEASAGERLQRMLVLRVLHLFDEVRAGLRGYDEMMGALRPRYMPRREGYLRAEAAVFAGVVAEGRATGELTTGGGVPEEVALSLLLATNALMPFSLSEKQREERDAVERRVRAIADLLLNGLRCRSVLSREPVGGGGDDEQEQGKGEADQ
jgi:AcrR family transcriptional regulator